MSTILRYATAGAVALSIYAFTLAGAHATVIGFSGAFDPANWSLTNTNADGDVDTSGAPGSIELWGGDNLSFSSGNTDFTLDGPLGGPVKFGTWHFDWAFTGEPINPDIPTGPGFDPSGYLINGAFVQVTDNGGLASQSGSVWVSVSAGDFIGFRVHTTDNIEGPGHLTISNFQMVPEPGTLALFGFGLLGLGLARRRGKTA